jgi:hypothetical protein
MIIQSNPINLNLLKFQIKCSKDKHMWREGHCCNILSAFAVNTYNKNYLQNMNIYLS